jgi:PmbA protein
MSSSWTRWWVAVVDVDAVLRYAERFAQEAEVCLVRADSLGADIRNGAINLGSRTRSVGLAVRTISDGRIGISSSNSPEQWKECVDAAVASGNLAGAQEWHGLPSAARPDRTPLCYDPSVRLDQDLLKRLAGEMISASADFPVQVTSGSAGLSIIESLIANSSGVLYEVPETSVSLMIETIAGQSTGSEYNHDYRLDRVDPAWVGHEAASLAAESVNGREIDSGIHDLVLSPHATAQFLGSTVVPALSGRNVHAGRSRFADKMGDGVMADHVNLIDDPLDRRGLGSTAWDAEAVLTRKNAFIDQGVLQMFAYDLKTAYRFKRESTGNAVRSGPGGSPSIGMHNLVLEGAGGQVDDGTCVYVHDVVGAHTANPFSGDFSVELSNAFFVRDGTREFPIKKVMWSGNAFDLFRQIRTVSADSRTMGSYILPLIRVQSQSLI